MVKRLVLGLLKGLVIGGALGALFFYAFGVQSISGALAFVLAGLAALLAGVFAGQPPWKKGAWIGSILKGLFGFGLGAGLYWVVQRFAPGANLQELLRASEATTIATAPVAFMPIVAAVYAMLVEIDDGSEEGSTADPALAKSTGIRVESIDVGEEGEEAEVNAGANDAKRGAKR
jgi:ABC-type Mn2+/Zn2+ transport system permease subunit